MRRLQNCCCCSLEAGVSALGWLGLTSAIFHVIGAFIPINTALASSLTVNGSNPYAIYIFIYLLGSGLVEIIVNVGLLWGIRNKNKYMLLPWLILRILTIVLVTIAILILGILDIVMQIIMDLDTTRRVIIDIIILVIILAMCAFWTYCWVCVISLYKNYGDENIGQSRHEEFGFTEHRPQVMSVHDNPQPYANVQTF